MNQNSFSQQALGLTHFDNRVEAASVTQICVTLLVQIKQGGNLETFE